MSEKAASARRYRQPQPCASCCLRPRCSSAFYADRLPGAGCTAFLAACTAYILLNVALQFLTGHNLYGNGPAAAGELTGPFDKPRAGPPLARMILPVIVPPAALLLGRRRAPSTLAAYALLLFSACLVVIISQRMPTVLTATGLVLSALLLPRLRPVVVIALLAGGLLVGASAVVSPPTWKRVVVQFSSQLENFGQSHYGFLYERSITMAEQNPVTGRGYDGFRSGCPLARYGAAELAGGTRAVQRRGGLHAASA